MILKHPPLRRFFYVCLAATAIGFGCRAVNAEPAIVSVAERYIGARNPTGHRGQWCGFFANMVLRKAGFRPMPGNRAIDGLRAGMRLPRAVPGSLIVRRHHVEIALGDGRSISGNWHGRVAIHASSRGVVIQPSRM